MVVAFLFARSLCVAPNSIADRICALPIINQNKCACSHSVVVVCRQRNPLLATEEPRRAVGRVRMYGEHAIFIIYGLAAIRWVAFYVCLFSSVCTRIYTFLPPPVSLRYSLSRYSSCFNINTLGVRRLGVSCWAWKMWMTVRAALDKSSARWLMCIFRDGLVCLNEQQKHSLPAEGSQQQCVYIYSDDDLWATQMNDQRVLYINVRRAQVERWGSDCGCAPACHFNAITLNLSSTYVFDNNNNNNNNKTTLLQSIIHTPLLGAWRGSYLQKPWRHFMHSRVFCGRYCDLRWLQQACQRSKRVHKKITRMSLEFTQLNIMCTQSIFHWRGLIVLLGEGGPQVRFQIHRYLTLKRYSCRVNVNRAI